MERDKGHNREVGPTKANDPLAYFGSVPRFAFVYRKTEKIITALYMVTSLLPDEEPLKWKVRKIGSDILSLTNQLKDKFSTQRDGVVHSIRSLSVEVASLLDIGRYSGLMSEMNARVLREELAGLLALISEDKDLDALSKGFVLEDSFFDAPAERNHPAGQLVNRAKGRDYAGRPAAFKRQTAPSAPKERAAEKNGRRTAVLDIVRAKGTVTIKDVSDVVSGVSEKTIQRELLSLVAEGLLKKEGERRWSRYSLKS